MSAVSVRERSCYLADDQRADRVLPGRSKQILLCVIV